AAARGRARAVRAGERRAPAGRHQPALRARGRRRGASRPGSAPDDRLVDPAPLTRIDVRASPPQEPAMRATVRRLIEATVAPTFGTASFTRGWRRWHGSACLRSGRVRERCQVPNVALFGRVARAG